VREAGFERFFRPPSIEMSGDAFLDHLLNLIH
jgi:hypothetical protein